MRALSDKLRAIAATLIAVAPPMAGTVSFLGKLRRFPKIVHRKQNFPRHRIAVHAFPRQLAKRFHLQVAPRAAGCSRLHQPIKFFACIAREFPAANPPPASGDQTGPFVDNAPSTISGKLGVRRRSLANPGGFPRCAFRAGPAPASAAIRGQWGRPAHRKAAQSLCQTLPARRTTSNPLKIRYLDYLCKIWKVPSPILLTPPGGPC